MNKLIKQLSFFSLLLVFYQNLYSTENFIHNYFNKEVLVSDGLITPQKVGCMITFSAVLAGTLYFFSNNYCASQDARYLLQKYPFTDLWYRSLIKKYSDINFDKKLLVPLWQDLGSYIRWDYFYHQINCHETILENINPIFRKKSRGFLLSAEENLFLNVQEFLFLCQVGHIEKNDSLVFFAGGISFLMAMESIKACGFIINNDAYKKLTYNPPVDPWQERSLKIEMYENLLGLHVSGFLPEIIMLSFYFVLIDEHQFIKSHEFACHHADINVLKEVLLFLKNSLTPYYEENFAADYKQDFFADPIYKNKVSDLIGMIEREIALRSFC